MTAVWAGAGVTVASRKPAAPHLCPQKGRLAALEISSALPYFQVFQRDLLSDESLINQSWLHMKPFKTAGHDQFCSSAKQFHCQGQSRAASAGF